jgi:amidase
MPRSTAALQLTRRSFLGAYAAAAASAPALAAASRDTETDPLFMSATRLAEKIRAREFSAEEAVKLYINRIEQVDTKINAVVARCFERALFEARRADEAMAAGRLLGPLHGVPMTIKDSFDTEGVVSTGGSMGRRNFIPGRDATVVARARAAGAILLGKTNTPEFTLGVGPRGTDNLVYGVTRNPYNLAHQPGASSGGSGASVSSGQAAFDIGSDFYGSIRDPSHSCGIAGLKPTHGLLPRTGHIIGYGGFQDSFQQVGPMARRAEDLALLLPLLAGPDASDAATHPVPVGNAHAVSLKGLRVAFYPTNGENLPSELMQSLVRQCAQHFAAAGCIVTEDMPPLMGELAEARAQFSNAAGGYLTRRLLEKAGTTEPYPATLYSDPRESPSPEMTRWAEEMDVLRGEQLRWFQKYDLILSPASQRAAQLIGAEQANPEPAPAPQSAEPKPPRKRRSPYYLGVYNTNGWPAGVVRAGTSDDGTGLPLGVQVIGRPWHDHVVIAGMMHIETLTGGFRKPPL